MTLQTSYRFIAPFYDIFLSRLTIGLRLRSLSRLPAQGKARVLLSGSGTGLDFPFLHVSNEYTAVDLTAAMLRRSYVRAGKLQVSWLQGDSMALPFADESYDYVVLHLIVAVVPHPERCLAEAARVLKPGGRILIFDKFLRRNQRAWLRRSMSLFMSKIATRLDVVFEDVLDRVPELAVVSDEPMLLGGWLRLIELRKKENDE